MDKVHNKKIGYKKNDAIFAINYEIEAEPNLKVTLPNFVSDELLEL